MAPPLRFARLTARQAELLALLADGHLYREIAPRMGIRLGTVCRAVQDLSTRVPGPGRPREKLTRWYLAARSTGNTINMACP